jgi:hypothetical protein
MCVLVDGQIQKELENGTVPIPFNSEYTLRFRNKNNLRAVVKFYIDGEDVSGSGYVIPANSHIDIKRHSNVDKSFKFVSLDSEDAIDQGKNGSNLNKIKGLIEAKFYLEKKQNYNVEYKSYKLDQKDNNHYWKYNYWNDMPKDFNYTFTNTTSDFSPYTITRGKDSISLSSTDIEKINISLNLNDGATVQGAKTGQMFSNVYIDLEDDYVCLKLFLQGFNKDKNFEVLSECKVIEKQNQELKEKIKIEQEKLRMKELIEENKLLKKQLEEIKLILNSPDQP